MDKSTRFSLTSLSFIIVKEKSAYGKYFLQILLFFATFICTTCKNIDFISF